MKKQLLLLLVYGIILSACSKNNDTTEKEPVAIQIDEKSKALIASSNHFGYTLFEKIASEESGNFMISPLSANVALSMLLNGTDGNTHDQILDMLGYPDGMNLSEVNNTYQSLVKQLLEADETVQIALANAVFYRNQFQVKQPFIDAMNLAYRATIQSLDFSSPSSVATINGWASDQTNGKIAQVIDNIDPGMVMFLMNALYFKGEWTKQFDANFTENQPFYLPDNSQVQVPMMQQSEMKAIYYQSSDYQAVEIPYGRKNFSMVLILPENGLTNFYTSFGPEEWVQLTTALDAQVWGEVMLSLPKFSFSYEKRLNDILKDLGMIDAFEPGLADLSRIADSDLYVDFVKQNTFVDVNEEGTEAAAVTTIGIRETSAAQPFIADRPFIFAIRERTSNTLMFIGTITNPLE